MHHWVIAVSVAVQPHRLKIFPARKRAGEIELLTSLDLKIDKQSGTDGAIIAVDVVTKVADAAIVADSRCEILTKARRTKPPTTVA